MVKVVSSDSCDITLLPDHQKPYNNVEFKDPIYQHEKYRNKRSILLPQKSKYSMRPMSSPRTPSYWPSYAGWYLSPHYYYAKSAFQNSQRQKFWNRKINFQVDDHLVAPPQPKPYYPKKYYVQRAVVELVPGSDPGVYGKLELTATHPHNGVSITGNGKTGGYKGGYNGGYSGGNNGGYSGGNPDYYGGGAVYDANGANEDDAGYDQD